MIDICDDFQKLYGDKFFVLNRTKEEKKNRA